MAMPFPELFFPGETVRRQLMLHEEGNARTPLQEEGCRFPDPIVDIVEKNVQGLPGTATHCDLVALAWDPVTF